MSYIRLKATHSHLRRLILILVASLFSAICYCIPAASAANNEVLINEVEVNPAGTDNVAEKVELYNPSNSSVVDITGWTISSTGGSAAATLVMSEGTILSPTGYHTVVGRDSQRWLDNIDEVIELRNESGILIDSAGLFRDGDNDHRTWQLSPDRQDNWVLSNSLGGANSVSSVSDLELSSPVAPGHPIIIQSEPSLSENSTTVEAVIPAIQPNQNLTIVFIDVGQGDSILVILPNTKTLLIDGGEREATGKVLATLQEHGLSRIDMVVATHPHADHIGGLIDVIKSVEVEQVLESGQVHTTQTFEDFLDAIETKQIPIKSVREGDSINLDPTVRIEVLNPPANLPDSAYNEVEFNDNSVVLKLNYGQFSALLTGDMEEINEARLVSENSTDLDVDVLKAAHHGSRTSSTSPFLNAVTPETVIISLGAGNTYGHPHQEALDRISAAGTELLFRTDVDGTITLTANSSSEYSIVTEKSMKKTFGVSKFERVCCSLQ